AVRGHRRADRRQVSPGDVSRRTEGARDAHRRTAPRDTGRGVRDADCSLLCDAADFAAPRPHGRGLRARVAACDGRVVRMRIGIWCARQRRLFAHRIPRLARRTQRDLPAHGRVHGGFSPLTNAAVLRAVAIAALGAAIAWALYLARDTILIIYISVLLAIG